VAEKGADMILEAADAHASHAKTAQPAASISS
jgi:hypothetical protein